MNKSEKCTGLWTRVEGASKSVLDYMLIDNENDLVFEEMLIDEDKEFAPISYEEGCAAYSDHNVMISKFNWVLKEEVREKSRNNKVITKEGYAQIKTDMEKEKVSEIFKQNDANTQCQYDKWKDNINRIVERNTSTVKKKNPRRVIRELIRRKRDLKKVMHGVCSKERSPFIQRLKILNERIITERRMQFNNKINKVVHKLKCKKGINGPNMWEVIKHIRGRRDQVATAILSKDGEVLEEAEKIRSRYLEHFKEILAPTVAVTDQEKNQEEFINLIFSNIMKLANTMEPQLTKKEEIVEAIKELKRKKCKDAYGWNNEIVLEGGNEMVESLLYLFRRMETERFTPRQWHEVVIKTVPKPGSGSILLMDNKRGLFLTEIVSKVYERVLKNRNALRIRGYISDLQTGGVKHRSTCDNHILVSETIRKQRQLNKKTYIVYGDAVKCFDKLWLRDCLVELYKADCFPTDIQMIYSMNKDTIIEVVTPSGSTEKVEVGEIVKQGTVLGPTLCCVETDQINKIGDDQERLIGTQKIAILIFVDDVMSAGNAGDIRRAIHNMAEMETLKKSTYGLKKTKYMVIDTARGEPEPITESVKNGVIAETDEYKYVGFWINKKGNCQLQIYKKKKSLKGEVIALKSIANFHNVGDMFVAVRLHLFESCVLPSLLYNLEAWTKQSKGEIKDLEKIQANILCTLLGLPKSTPYLGLLNELGIWRIEERLIYRKLMLYNNLINSDENRLAKRVVEEQEQTNDLEGSFFGTVLEMTKSIGVTIKQIKHMKKSSLKKLIKNKLNERMCRIVSLAIPKMTKLRFIVKPHEFKRKKYIVNLKGNEAIQALRCRLNMIQIYGNYHGDITLQRLCPHCEEEDDTTEHLLNCKVFHTSIHHEHLKNEHNSEMWRQILEMVNFNLKHRGIEDNVEGKSRYSERLKL